MLGTSLAPRVIVTMRLNCTLCHSHIDSDHAKIALVDMLINSGIKEFKYRICPKCFNVLDEADIIDQNFKRRWMRGFKKLEQKIGRAVLEEKIKDISANDMLLYCSVTLNKNMFRSWKEATNFDGMLVIRF